MNASITEIRVKSIADLAPLLEHSDPKIRAAAFNSVLEEPGKALALAPAEGRDIVDVLNDRLARRLPRHEKVPLLTVLGQFRDTRVDEVFLSILRHEDSDELLHLAARYIDAAELQVPKADLLNLLRSNDNLSKVRIAAGFLSGGLALDVADQIRVGAFSDAAQAFPDIDDTSAEGWVEALQSPLGEFLCLVLEKRGPELVSYHRLWSQLDATLQSWLVRRACNHNPAEETLIRLGLGSEREAVREATVAAIRLYRPELKG